MKKAKKIAMAGIFTALCTVFLFIGSLFQTLDLSAAAIGSIIILIAFIELGKGWAFGIYAATSLLSMLILPYKTAAAVFAMLLGFYPILKEPLNRIKPIALSLLARIAVFNLFLTAVIYVSTAILHIDEDFFAFGVVIYAVANVAFVIYDLALERVSVLYTSKLRSLIFKRR